MAAGGHLGYTYIKSKMGTTLSLACLSMGFSGTADLMVKLSGSKIQNCVGRQF